VRKIIRKLVDCLFLLRLPLLVPVWTILLLGWITSGGSVRVGGFIVSPAALSGHLWIIISAFSLIVASIYVTNQIVDIESDRINDKLFLLPQGFVSIPAAWIITAICILGGLMIELAFIKSTPVLILFLLSLLLGIFYNLPPLRLKNHAVGGVLANALGHGMLTFLVGWYASRALMPSADQLSLDFLKHGLLSGIAPSLANGAVYLATTIPDAAGDRQTGKRTFSVAFGEKKTAITAAALCAGSLIFSFFMSNYFWILTIVAALSLIVFIRFAVTAKQSHAFSAFKCPVILLTCCVALFVPEYAILTLMIFFASKIYYKQRFGMDYPTLKA
jgi:4-hydroxybenzoate polyprenyltransferase